MTIVYTYNIFIIFQTAFKLQELIEYIHTYANICICLFLCIFTSNCARARACSGSTQEGGDRVAITCDYIEDARNSARTKDGRPRWPAAPALLR